MSYEIMYDKKFIKVSNGIIPLVLTGSNNCWSGNKRARDWSLAWDFFKDVIYSENEIKNLMIEKLPDNLDYISIGGKSSKQLVINYYNNGIKNALSIEDTLKMFMTSFRGLIQVYDEKIEPYYNRYQNVKDTYIKTTEELENFIKEYKTIKELETKPVYLTLAFTSDDKLKLRYEFRKPKNTNPKEKIRNYVIKESWYDYIVKTTSKGFQYTSQKNYAMGFEKESQALKYIEKLQAKMGSGYQFTCERLS